MDTKRGAAAVELVVGLIAVLALVAGAYQLTLLMNAQSTILTEARQEAANLAIGASIGTYSPEYIAEVTVGPDGKPYTVDDGFTGALAYEFQSDIVSYTATDTLEWETLDAMPGDRMVPLLVDPNPGTLFGLVPGHAEAEVDLLPSVQHLFFDAESITLEHDVWMTKLGGIY